MRRPNVRLFSVFVAGVAAGAIFLGAGTVPVSGAAPRYEDLSLFASVLDLVRKNYVGQVDEEKLVQGALRGMLQELDPHSSYLDPDAHKEMQVDTRGEFFGLGIEITKREDGVIEVVSPIDGTPAAAAGVRAKDQIVSICPQPRPEGWNEDCKPTKTMTLFDAVKLMRGPRGSEITIHLFRDGFARPKPFTLARDSVKVASVDGRMLEPGMAYVRVRSFQERTDQELVALLEKLHEESGEPFRGLVLDLRDNPGGLLNQSVAVSNLFLTEGRVVSTHGRHPDSHQFFEASGEDITNGKPIAVLVDGDSASAAEIVAAALQDNRRAVVVGSNTYGKGTVQTVLPMPNQGEITLTWARFHAPSGYTLHHLGVLPTVCTASYSNADMVLRDLNSGKLPVVPTGLRNQTKPADTAGLESLRKTCPARETENPIDLEVALKLVRAPEVYAEAVHLAEPPQLGLNDASDDTTALTQ